MVLAFLITLGIIALVALPRVIMHVIMQRKARQMETRKEEPIPSVQYYEKPLALIFNSNCSETDLVDRAQELTQQQYSNYQAYFFIDESLVLTNKLKNLNFIPLPNTGISNFDMLEYIKPYLHGTPEGVIIIDSKEKLEDAILVNMNKQLLQGKKLVQTQIFSNPVEAMLAELDLQDKGVISAIETKSNKISSMACFLKKHGYMLHYLLFKQINFSGISRLPKQDSAYQSGLSIQY